MRFQCSVIGSVAAAEVSLVDEAKSVAAGVRMDNERFLAGLCHIVGVV